MASGDYSLVVVYGLLIAVDYLLEEHDSRVQAQTSLVAPRHMGSPQTRDQTHVPCIDRCILNHRITREVPPYLFLTCSILHCTLSIDT